MHTFNTYYRDQQQFSKFVTEHALDQASILVQVFSSELNLQRLLSIRDAIMELLPQAKMIGSTTDGEFIGSKISTDKTIVSISVFEKTSVQTSLQELSQDNSYQNGVQLAAKLVSADTKALILFTDGMYSNGERFLQGVQSVSQDIIVAGGMAGDGATFINTIVFTENQHTLKGSVGASLQSKNLIVNNKMSFNWQGIGKKMIITNAKENRVYAIDDETPVSIYAKYLGKDIAASLPATGIEFPLIIERNGVKIARAVLAKEEDGSLIFAGNLNNGDEVHLGFGNIDMIIQDTKLSNIEMQDFPIESIFVYSCMARRRFLQESAAVELLPLESIAPLSGFFTYGEFFKSEKCELLNQTMTILTLSETDINHHAPKHFDQNIQADATLKALSHLINVTSHELQDFNQKLEEKVEEKTIQLQQKVYELEVATKVKSDFLANMSHEIRTPLNAMLGFVDILMAEENDKDKIKKFGVIQRSGHSLLSIINDILDLSKLEQGKVFVEQMRFYTKQPFKDVCELFYDKAKEKNIKFSYHIDENVPRFTIGDPLRIKQIISNFLSNAIKFTPEAGEVSLSVHYDPQTKISYCDVSDTGIGIKAENIENIFEAFSQEDISTTRKFGGTGLGLSISKKLATLMQGDIKLKSIFNKGSTFTLILPQLNLPSKEKLPEKKIKKIENTKNITFDAKLLLVEDNSTNRMLVQIYLDTLGIRHEFAVDGLAALEKFKENSYDLILMDENMPNMNGIEATQAILEYENRHQMEHTPIIALTANALSDDRERFLNAGMDEYLAKPVTRDDLINVFAKFLDYRRSE